MIRIETGDWMDTPANPGRHAFAIGDVHGRADLLQALHSHLKAEQASRPELDGALLVHIGDYIDRGPRSIPALRMAIDGVEGYENVALPGNHEQFMRHFMRGPENERAGILALWARNGAWRILDELNWGDSFKNLHLLIAKIEEAVGLERIERLFSSPTYHRAGNTLFVHAGIHPRIGLEMLDDGWGRIPMGKDGEDVSALWVRGPFLTHYGPFEEDVVVVHGHTIFEEPQALDNRIAIDTGAYESGNLTCAELAGGRLRFLTATTVA